MAGFHDIIGHDDIIRHLKNAIETGKVSHSYIFTGEPGSGKKLLAGTFAAALQCESGESEPCMTCDSCKKVIGKNHPDIITVTHEKPGSISIDEVREQVVHDVDIKPYCSPYKIYIIPDAEMMTVQAQNALLKTIEEPPEYAVILLLTSNIDSLLPTIRSRCVRLDLKVVDDGLVKKYLMEHLQVPDYQARASAAFAQGNLGKAMRYAKSEDFIERKDHIISLLRHVEQMDLSEMLAVIKDLGTRKDEVRDYIDLMVLWYRDVLLFKATKDINQLLFQDEASYISREASHRSYEKIEEILQAFEKAKVRLRANVNFDITMELMLLALK